MTKIVFDLFFLSFYPLSGSHLTFIVSALLPTHFFHQVKGVLMGKMADLKSRSSTAVEHWSSQSQLHRGVQRRVPRRFARFYTVRIPSLAKGGSELDNFISLKYLALTFRR